MKAAKIAQLIENSGNKHKICNYADATCSTKANVSDVRILFKSTLENWQSQRALHILASSEINNPTRSLDERGIESENSIAIRN